jgi:hypothetical protein
VARDFARANMRARLTAVPVLQAQSCSQCQNVVSSELLVSVKPIMTDFRQVMSPIDKIEIDCRSAEAKKSVRQWKFKSYFGYRYVGRTLKRAAILLTTRETAS